MTGTRTESPKIFTVLLGPRNGWFIYTPLMLLAFLSLIYLTTKRKLNSIPTLIILIVIIYLNGSWWRPTFSASTGYRTLIEYLPVMAIPLGFLIQKVYEGNRKTLKVALNILLVIFIVYNVLFSYKYNSHIWWNEEWTWSNFARLVKF